MSQSSSSLTENTYKDLRAYLVSGGLVPDQKLKISELSARLAVSPSVVREGLSRLVSDGLVTAQPQRGFRVAELDTSKIDDLFDARVEVERLCLIDALRHGDIAWEAQLLASLHELSRTPEECGIRGDDVSSAWRLAHADFHATLVAPCRNKWYLKLRNYLYLHSERFRALSLQMNRDRRDLHDEHERIVRAAIARDEHTVCALMTLHLRRTADDLTRHLQPRTDRVTTA